MLKLGQFDTLRLVAAWLVLFSHGYSLSGIPEQEPLLRWTGQETLGGVGVGLFFVLSGYLVTLSWLRCPRLGVFMAKRALRIFPALVVVTVLSVAVLGPLVSSLSWTSYWASSDTWKYLRNVVGWRMSYTLPGVFETHSGNQSVNGSLWSLPLELRCYVGLALLGLLSRWVVGLRYLVLAAAVYFFIGAVTRPTDMPALVSHLGLNFNQAKLGLLFCFGACVASWSSAQLLNLLPAWAGLTVLLAMLLPAGQHLPLLWMAGAAALLWWATRGPTWLAWPTRWGDWSYGLYLYAFPVQQLWVAQGLHHKGVLLYTAVCSASALALAWASWHGVEKLALAWKPRTTP